MAIFYFVASPAISPVVRSDDLVGVSIAYWSDIDQSARDALAGTGAVLVRFSPDEFYVAMQTGLVDAVLTTSALTADRFAASLGSTSYRAESNELTATFYFDGAITPTVGPDVIVLTDASDHLISAIGGNDVVRLGAGKDTIFGGLGDDTLISGLGADSVLGGGGDDLILTGAGDDSAFGHDGADTIWGGAGNDYAILGAGHDIYRDIVEDGPANSDTIHGGWGRDTVTAGAGRDLIRGERGNDLLFGGSGNDEIRGGPGDDRIFGGYGRDQLFGGGGNDWLAGGIFKDSIYGGSGNDTILGGSHDDTLGGGSGADVFIFSNGNDSGHDVIADFELGMDQIDLSRVRSIADMSDLNAAAVTLGAHTVIFLNSQSSIRLNDVIEADLSAGDFIFT